MLCINRGVAYSGPNRSHRADRRPVSAGRCPSGSWRRGSGLHLFLRPPRPQPANLCGRSCHEGYRREGGSDAVGSRASPAGSQRRYRARRNRTALGAASAQRARDRKYPGGLAAQAPSVRRPSHLTWVPPPAPSPAWVPPASSPRASGVQGAEVLAAFPWPWLPGAALRGWPRRGPPSGSGGAGAWPAVTLVLSPTDAGVQNLSGVWKSEQGTGFAW